MSQKDRCCVPGCDASGNSHKVLHGFPSPTCDLQRFRSWVFAIGGEVGALDNFYIHKYRRVCHNHFDKKYLCHYNRISNIAIPTLNMSDNDAYEDHNYYQDQDDNYCPDTVAVEYEITSDNMHTIDLPNEGIEEVSESGIPFISNHFNNRLVKHRSHCLTPQMNGQKVSGICFSNISNDKQVVNNHHFVESNTNKVNNDIKDEQIRSLKKQCRILKAKLKKHQKRIICYKQQIKSSKSLTKEKFDALTERVPEVGKRLMWMQLHQPKKKNGYRFDTKEKLMCLAIKKYKPECFKFLKKAFLMPGNKTLKNFIEKLQLPESNKQEDEHEPNIDEYENEEVISDSLIEKAASEAQIAYEMHKSVLGEVVQFNNSTNLADFTDFQHGLC